MIYAAFRFFFPITTFPRDPAKPTSALFIFFSLNVRRWCFFGVLQVRGVNVHIFWHGATHENEGMIKVIKHTAVNIVPSECYHKPDGDANRYRILQISP
jgi:hypothetical protein